MIQLLGLRDYVNKKTGKSAKADRFFEKGWRFASIQEVFGPRGRELIESIPAQERYNLYYTAAHCFEDAKRKMKEMHIIPFDIDGIAYTPETYKQTCLSITAVVAEVLKVDASKLGVIFSGNGVQVIVNITPFITDTSYFSRYKKHYNVLIEQIRNKLKDQGLQGDPDPVVFDDARILRMPHTMNRKPGKPERMAEVIQGSIEPVPWDIVALSGIDEPGNEIISDEVLKNYPKPDADAVISECHFIQHCASKPAAISEPAWYAMVSVTSRLDDSGEITHRLSQGHPHYSHHETEAKIIQSIASGGPKKCSTIDTLWDGCKQCPHWTKVTSPIQIKGNDYIASSDFGFRERKTDSKGNVKSGPPAYDDIIKAFSNKYNYRVLAGTEEVISYKETHWVVMEDIVIQALLREWIKPSATMSELKEALGRIKTTNVIQREDFRKTTEGLLNFKTCVYDIVNDKQLEHGPEYGFFNVIPYGYDPTAVSPMWDKFLDQIMLGKQSQIDLLMRFAGYCLSFDSCWAQMCLILVGDGSNGKSVFMKILSKVLGTNNTTSLPMSKILKDATLRLQLVNSYFNYSDETSIATLRDSADFKSLIQGGDMIVKKLYTNEESVQNRTKFILSCNEMPRTTDNTYAFYRRLAIVHFNFTVRPGDGTYDARLESKLEAELPGICNAVIRAYKKLAPYDYFEVSEESRQAVQQYSLESDTVALFISEAIEMTESADDKVKFTQLCIAYGMYCKESGYDQLTKLQFSKRLSQLTRGDTVLERKNGQTYRVRTNMKLNKEY